MARWSANIGTQDLGVGTRTCLGIVVAESLGLPLEAVQVNIGRNSYPHDGASGGSTTIGGISSSSRRAAIAALNELLKKVADQLQIDADKLGSRRRQNSRNRESPESRSPGKKPASCSAKPRSPSKAQHTPGARTELTGSGVGGVQMADVSVDIETGIRDDERNGGRARLRPDHRSENRRKPGLRRADYGRHLRAVRRSDLRSNRPAAC